MSTNVTSNTNCVKRNILFERVLTEVINRMISDSQSIDHIQPTTNDIGDANLLGDNNHRSDRGAKSLIGPQVEEVTHG